MINTVSSDGKKYKYREYPVGEKEDNYMQKLECKANKTNFRYLHKLKKEYPRYSGKIVTDTVHDGCYIQYDSTVRIYLLDIDSVSKPLFTSGLLYPTMFYCAYDRQCKPFLYYIDTTISSKHRELFKKYGEPQGPVMYRMDSTYSKTLDTIYSFHIVKNKDFYGWNGYALHVQPIVEEKSIEKHNTKVYKITVFIYDGGINPTDYVYYIELKNPNCGNKKNLSDFVKKARVSLFYFYTQAFEI